jgi:hypothetical protein
VVEGGRLIPEGTKANRTKDIVVPLIGTGCAFAASLLSVVVLFYLHYRSENINNQLWQIQQDQFKALQSAKTDEFARDSERQYVALVYQDLISKDPGKQDGALLLLKILQPSTALKLVDWATRVGIILPENKDKSQLLTRSLEISQDNARFRIFLHVGQSGTRQVPSEALIRRELTSSGFGVVGSDLGTDQYGPGVDYFHDDDKRGAEGVAGILSKLRDPDGKPIPARKQSAGNPSGYLGVWF